jgi:anion-transporting  ArsA/GET3 family ATPase
MIEIVSGKGGVGKSAVTAALARLHAGRGERVLAMAMRPGGGLGPHLGLRSLGFAPSIGVDGVFAMEIDKAAALEEYVRIYSPLPLVAQVGKAIHIFDVLAEAAPGVREIVTIGKVVYECWEGPWDRVIVDAVPTGQLTSHLEAPEVIAELIPTGRVKDQSARIHETLVTGTSVTLVTVAEELPVTETNEALADMAHLPPTIMPTIVNRLLAPPPATPDDVTPAGRTALEFHRQIAASQATWVDQLDIGPRLPYLFGTDDALLVSEFLAAILGDHR